VRHLLLAAAIALAPAAAQAQQDMLTPQRGLNDAQLRAAYVVTLLNMGARYCHENWTFNEDYARKTVQASRLELDGEPFRAKSYNLFTRIYEFLFVGRFITRPDYDQLKELRDRGCSNLHLWFLGPEGRVTLSIPENESTWLMRERRAKS